MSRMQEETVLCFVCAKWPNSLLIYLFNLKVFFPVFPTTVDKYTGAQNMYASN